MVNTTPTKNDYKNVTQNTTPITTIYKLTKNPKVNPILDDTFYKLPTGEVEKVETLFDLINKKKQAQEQKEQEEENQQIHEALIRQINYQICFYIFYFITTLTILFTGLILINILTDQVRLLTLTPSAKKILNEL